MLRRLTFLEEKKEEDVREDFLSFFRFCKKKNSKDEGDVKKGESVGMYGIHKENIL